METIEQKLSFFCELISCNSEMFLWEYDTEMHLLQSNCPLVAALSTIFSIDNNPQTVLHHMQKHTSPLIVTNDMGMMWIADADRDKDKLHRIHLLGPVFTAEFPMKAIQKGMDRLHLSQTLRDDVFEMLQQLPVIAMTRLFEYGIMFHYCLTGQKITVSDFSYHQHDEPITHTELRPKADTRSSWATEQEFLKNVQEGNLKYKEKSEHLVSNDNLGIFSTGDPIRQIKNTIIISIALVTRAAIKGGLSPEMAYTLSDYYVQSIEACTAIPEIVEVNSLMKDDFIQRVHRIRESTGISSSIQKCCDYINFHIGENITVHEVAQYAGYADYYLGKKFQKEMGLSVKQYILNGKIERAKHLLRSSGQSIQEISEALSYNSQSYFTEQFRKATGMSPSEYRNSI